MTGLLERSVESMFMTVSFRLLLSANWQLELYAKAAPVMPLAVDMHLHLMRFYRRKRVLLYVCFYLSMWLYEPNYLYFT